MCDNVIREYVHRSDGNRTAVWSGSFQYHMLTVCICRSDPHRSSGGRRATAADRRGGADARSAIRAYRWYVARRGKTGMPGLRFQRPPEPRPVLLALILALILGIRARERSRTRTRRTCRTERRSRTGGRSTGSKHGCVRRASCVRPLRSNPKIPNRTRTNICNQP
jgi:hypothetical protein